MTINEFKRKAMYFCNTIPQFIDEKDIEHKYLYDNYREIMVLQYRMISEYILPESKLANIKRATDGFKHNMYLATLDEDLVNKLLTYQVMLFSELQNIAIDNELYESAQNIKAYFNLPEKNMNIIYGK